MSIVHSRVARHVTVPDGYVNPPTPPNVPTIVAGPPTFVPPAPAPVTMSTGEALPQYSTGVWAPFHHLQWSNMGTSFTGSLTRQIETVPMPGRNIVQRAVNNKITSGWEGNIVRRQ